MRSSFSLLPIIIIITISLATMPFFSCTDNAIKYYNLGLDAVAKNDMDEAIEMWRKSLEYRPDDPETRYNIGLALLENELYAEAEEELNPSGRMAVLSG